MAREKAVKAQLMLSEEGLASSEGRGAAAAGGDLREAGTAQGGDQGRREEQGAAQGRGEPLGGGLDALPRGAGEEFLMWWQLLAVALYGISVYTSDAYAPRVACMTEHSLSKTPGGQDAKMSAGSGAACRDGRCPCWLRQAAEEACEARRRGVSNLSSGQGCLGQGPRSRRGRPSSCAPRMPPVEGFLMALLMAL